MPLVLIVEDDAIIARTISAHLRQAGMDVEWAADGDAGFASSASSGPTSASSISCSRRWTAGRYGRARAEGLETPI